MIDRASRDYSRSLPTPRTLTADQRAALGSPTYVAIADDASLAGGDRAAEAARDLPDATVVVWPDTTHSLPMQVAEPLAADLSPFWAAHDD